MATKLFETSLEEILKAPDGNGIGENPNGEIYKFDSTANFTAGTKLMGVVRGGTKKIIVKSGETAVYAVDAT